jgi:hypothetical protein
MPFPRHSTACRPGYGSFNVAAAEIVADAQRVIGEHADVDKPVVSQGRADMVVYQLKYCSRHVSSWLIERERDACLSVARARVSGPAIGYI